MRVTSSRSGWREDPIRTEVVPARPGATRTITHLGEHDRRRYEVAVAAVIPDVERVLGAGVVANRARPTPVGVALEPWGVARRRYARSIATAAAGPWRAAFVGDVHDCYGSIDPSIAERSLRSIGASGGSIERVGAILRRLEDRGVRGLPVGPEPSAVLANAVLASVDRALAAAVCRPAFRWVDDVVVFAHDRREARTAAATFARALDALGLEAHPEKCRIVRDPGALRAVVSGRSATRGPARGMMRPP